MGKCKNTECQNETINNRVYCCDRCRNYFVNKFIRDYTKNGEGISKKYTDGYKQTTKTCENPNCSKVITYGKRRNRYCNHSCAVAVTNVKNKGKKHNLSDAGLQQIRKANREKSGLKIGEYESSPKLCFHCSTPLSFKKRGYKFCSSSCRKEDMRKNMSEYSKYKQDANFAFNLASFPDEFNFELIKIYGWYSPSNSKKPNIGGVSRDHILSVNEGFKMGVNPKIISHPANCKLMVHSENISKNKKSNIIISELIDKINAWDLKYLVVSGNR